MADHHAEPAGESHMDRYIIIAVIFLSIIYLLAKGCTNKEERAMEEHHAAYNSVRSEMPAVL